MKLHRILSLAATIAQFTGLREPTSRCPCAADWGCSDLAPCCLVAGCCGSGSTCYSVTGTVAQGRRSRCRLFQAMGEPVETVIANPWLTYEDYRWHCWFHQTGRDLPMLEAQGSVVGHIQ